MTENQENTCRTCLSNQNDLLSIFDNNIKESESPSINKMIEICTGINIKINDDFPLKICKLCLTELKQSYEFRNKTLASDKILHERVKIEYSSDNNPIEMLKIEMSNEESDCDTKKIIKNNKKIKKTRNRTKKIVSHECNVCNRIFNSTDRFRQHKEIHKETYDHLCNICGKKFKTSLNYRSHMKKHDPNGYICQICKKPFSNNFQLNRHMVSHTGEKPYSCEICGSSFTQNTYLTIHRRTHTGENPYKCRTESCNEAFHAASARLRHERYNHLDPSIRPFKCEYCSQTFRRSDTLRSHQKIHFGERHYCEFCNKGFVKKSNLTLHLRTHTGEKPFRCKICDKAFSQNQCLKSHIKTQHPDGGDIGVQ